jgi:hypothetical protein
LEPLIDTLSKLSRVLSSKISGSLGLQICKNKSMAKVALIHITRDRAENPNQCLFLSQMWVKGTTLHFIVDRGSQKNLISIEIIKRLKLPTMP